MRTTEIHPRAGLSRTRSAFLDGRRVAGTAAGWLTHVASSAVGRHRRSVLMLLLLLVVAGTFHAVGMYGNPQVIDDEGTYVAQAWAVVRLGELAHYTFWYDHPPLGWLQLAGYAQLTGAFDRVEHAIHAGREFVFVTHLISVGLLWALCRRLHLARWSSAVAVLVFSVSPLAVQFHRAVFLDNIATPWILAAFVLAASPRRRMAEVAVGAVCFAVAVLTKETSLLLLPAFGAMLWQSTDPSTRRYVLAVASSLFLAIGSAYVLFAVVKGELVPGEDRVSLLEGVQFQLFGREGGGSVLAAGSPNRVTADVWFDLDWITPLVAAVVTPLALAVRRLRPIAVGYGVMALLLVRPGYLPVPFVIATLPLAAVLIGGVADEAWKRAGGPSWLRTPLSRHRPFAPVLLAVGVALLVVAAPLWGAKHRGLFRSDPDRPVREAAAWIIENVPRDHRLMIDDVFYVDLVQAGFDRTNVVWAYKVDTDPAVQTLSPRGWRDYDQVVVTESMRRAPDMGAQVSLAIENSVALARFGEDDTMVEVRRIVDTGDTGPDAVDAEADRSLRAAAGAALVRNPVVDAAAEAESALLAGAVDERLMTVLAAAAQTWTIDLAEFPVVHGEQELGTPRRVALITAIDGQPASSRAERTSLERWLEDQSRFGIAAARTADGLAVSVPPAVPGQDRAFTRTTVSDLPSIRNQEESQ